MIFIIIAAGWSERRNNIKENLYDCEKAFFEQKGCNQERNIIISEIGPKEQLKADFVKSYGQWLFTKHDKDFNRSLAFNTAIEEINPNDDDILCLSDLDIFVDEDFVQRCEAYISSGFCCVIPYSEIYYLNESFTREVITQRWLRWGKYNINNFKYNRKCSIGGILLIKAGLYRQIEGFDNNYNGWGSEDVDFFLRAQQITEIFRGHVPIVHLYHSPVSNLEIQKKENRKRLERKLFPNQDELWLNITNILPGEKDEINNLRDFRKGDTKGFRIRKKF